MTMRCRNGQEHTHETVAQSRACWLGGQQDTSATLAQPVATDTPCPFCGEPKGQLAHACRLVTVANAAAVDGMAREMAKRVVAKRATEAKATEGMYRTADGQIYKVQVAVHGSGQLYAKRLDMATQKFVMAKGAVARLTQADRMSLDEAKAFGKLYGFCVRCGAQLTDEDSIALGVGPVCAGKI